MTITELNKRVDFHQLWLEQKAGGQRATLRNAHLSNVDLSNLRLRKANLSGVNFRDANLSGADLGGVNLTNANLTNANLSDTNLIGANLIGANLRGTNLSNANLISTNLIGANLIGANLIGANLTNANLSDTNLIGATRPILHFPKTQYNRITNYCGGVVFCGCFRSTLENFKKEVEKKPNNCPRKAMYLGIISKIESKIKNHQFMEKMTIDTYFNGEEVEVCATYDLKDNNGIEIIRTEDTTNGDCLVFLGSGLEAIKEKIWDNLFAADNADDTSYPY